MKAWHCFSESPEYGSLLVYADTRNRARYKALTSAWDWCYLGVSAVRARPEFDDLYDAEKIVESNDDLPAKTPRFYNEDLPWDWD